MHLVNYRDFHTMNTNHFFDLRQEVNKAEVKLIIDGKIKIRVEGEYLNENNIKSYNKVEYQDIRNFIS